MESTNVEKNKTKTSKKERILLTLIASVIAPFIVFVAIPMIVFSNNIDEFLFNWTDFVPMCLGLMIFCSAIIFFAIFFLPEKAYKICLHILIAGDFLVFMQSTYLNGKLTLSGDAVGGGSTLSSIINLAFWIIVIAGAVVLAVLKDKKKYIKTGALLLCVVVTAAQFISTVVPVVSNKKFFQTRAERIGQDDSYIKNYSTYKNITNYSTSSNIYYFLIDSFDEKYAETAYDFDNTIYDKLTGFTWYQDHITMYGHTFPAIAYALTGYEHSCEYNREPYLDDAYEFGGYIKELYDAGYSVNVYSDSYHSYSNAGLPDYVANTDNVTYSLTDRLNLFKQIIKLGFYISAPTITKSLVGELSTSSFQHCFTYQSETGIMEYATYYDVDWFKNYIKTEGFKETTQKQFFFIHMPGPHDPVTESDQSKSNSSTGVLKKHLSAIDVFMQNLKDNGLYDDATVVITGDHPSGYDTFTGIKETRQTALFFKPSQSESESQEALKISTAKVEQKNIMPSIFDSVGLTSETASEKGDTPLRLTDSSDRKHVWHTYYCDVVEYIYSIRGAGNNLDNWHEVSKIEYNKRVTD